mmetsp:Transcript_82762/g.239451  ORF Transcript_82762/g.239451 Transcript_82762/m.239451 type:complete len:99 (-) Transcript_82762:193-489(-)
MDAGPAASPPAAPADSGAPTGRTGQLRDPDADERSSFASSSCDEEETPPMGVDEEATPEADTTPQAQAQLFTAFIKGEPTKPVDDGASSFGSDSNDGD